MTTRARAMLAGGVTRRGTPGDFVPIREPGTGWLLFKYDPARQLIEIQRRGVKTLVDLRQIQVDVKLKL